MYNTIFVIDNTRDWHMKNIKFVIVAFLIQVIIVSCNNEPIDVVEENTIGVKTIVASNITYGSAMFSGVLELPETLADDFEYGIEVALNSNFTENTRRIKAASYDEENTFYVEYSKLLANTTYSYRSYMINNKVVYVGDTKKFLTSELVSTGEIDSLNNVRSVLLVDRDNIVGENIEYGICYHVDVDGIVGKLYLEASNYFKVYSLDSLNGYSITIGNNIFSNFSYRAFVSIDGLIHYGQIKQAIGNKLITGDFINNYVQFGVQHESTAITEIGVCYANHEHPVVEDKKATTGLLYNLPYGRTYYRTYARVIGLDEPLYGPEKYIDKSVVVGEIVDMGLSVNWATFNIGATTPEEFGDYYAWGETEIKSDYTWNTYKYHVSGYSDTDVQFSKYVSDSRFGSVDYKTILEKDDDIAQVLWGGNWRMPSYPELYELRCNCSFNSTTQNGIKGYIITSRITGYEDRSIFLPASGYINSNGLQYANTNYYYSSYYYYSSSSLNQLQSSCPILLGGDERFTREMGYVVRPVCVSESWITNIAIVDSIDGVELIPGVSAILKPTITQNNEEIDYVLTWTSSNPSVATVNDNGGVYAVSAGTATITGSVQTKSISYTVKVIEESEFNHEYVDLGLSVKWATVNVGSMLPEQWGRDCFYAWGETSEKDNYGWSTYKWCNGSGSSITKYNSYSDKGTVDNKTVLDLDDDLAHVRWGGNWRMPTKEEFDELIDNTTITTVSGGYKFTSNKPGYTDKYIILPDVQMVKRDQYVVAESTTRYWSSSIDENNSENAYFLALSRRDNRYYTHAYLRNWGFPVRPVCP